MTVDPLKWINDLEGVPSAFAATRDGIDQALRDRGLRRTAPEVTTESLIRGAHASAILEGSSSSLDEVRAGTGDDIARAAMRVSTEVLTQAPILARSPLQALARWHALADPTSPATAGRPRSAEAAAGLRDLSKLLQMRTAAPALTVAAVAHAEFIRMAPFASYNGVIGRALERALIAQRGVDEKSLMVPEAAHLKFRPGYERNLAAFGENDPTAIHQWLLYTAEAYTLAMESSPLND